MLHLIEHIWYHSDVSECPTFIPNPTATNQIEHVNSCRSAVCNPFINTCTTCHSFPLFSELPDESLHVVVGPGDTIAVICMKQPTPELLYLFSFSMKLPAFLMKWYWQNWCGMPGITFFTASMIAGCISLMTAIGRRRTFQRPSPTMAGNAVHHLSQ